MQLELDPILLDSTIEATRRGLSMTGVEPPAVGASRLYRAQPYSIIIGLVGTSSGSCTLSLSEIGMLHLSGKLLGMEVTECDEDVFDAMMELGNMVGGCLKDLLLDTEYRIEAVSLPSLVLGGGHQVYLSRNVHTLSVDFELTELPAHHRDRYLSTTVCLMRTPGSFR